MSTLEHLDLRIRVSAGGYGGIELVELDLFIHGQRFCLGGPDRLPDTGTTPRVNVTDEVLGQSVIREIRLAVTAVIAVRGLNPLVAHTAYLFFSFSFLASWGTKSATVLIL